MNLVGEFKKGVVEVKNRFEAFKEEDEEDTNIEAEDKAGRKEDLESEVEDAVIGELVDSDSDGDEAEVEEEIFIGNVGADNRKKMKIKFQVADVKTVDSRRKQHI